MFGFVFLKGWMFVHKQIGAILRNLIELLDDPEINNAHLTSSWIDPKRVPMYILVSLNRRCFDGSL